MIENEISAWRAYLTAHGDVSADNLEELESHLRDQIDELIGSGLSDDEAFIVAVRRSGSASCR